MGLRIKFGFYTGIFTMVAMFAFGAYFANYTRTALKEEMVLRGVTIARNLATNAEDPLSIGDDLSLAKLVFDTKRDNEGVLYCFITDINSWIVAHDDIYQVGRLHEPLGAIEPLDDAPYRSRVYSTAQGGTIYETVFPIEIKGERIGLAHLGISGRSIQEAINLVTRRTVLFTLVAMFVGGLLAVGITSFTTRHIGRITEDIVAIGEGDLDRPIIVKGRDEIARIGAKVREMAQKLKRAQAGLIDRERMKREMELAREIHRTLLPGSLPQPPGYEFTSFYRPSRELSGDYYDVIQIPEDRLGLVIADVAGKGVGSSLISIALRSALKIESQKIADAREMILRIHSLLRGDIPEGGFITIFYGILDLQTGELSYASAAHNPAVFYQRRTDKISLLKPSGLPLGMGAVDETTWRSCLELARVKIDPGDLLILYTDGIPECRNPEGRHFGMDRFLRLIKEAKSFPMDQFQDYITRALGEFMAGALPHDDIAFLAVKRTRASEV